MVTVKNSNMQRVQFKVFLKKLMLIIFFQRGFLESEYLKHLQNTLSLTCVHTPAPKVYS